MAANTTAAFMAANTTTAAFMAAADTAAAAADTAAAAPLTKQQKKELERRRKNIRQYIGRYRATAIYNVQASEEALKKAVRAAGGEFPAMTAHGLAIIATSIEKAVQATSLAAKSARSSAAQALAAPELAQVEQHTLLTNTFMREAVNAATLTSSLAQLTAACGSVQELQELAILIETVDPPALGRTLAEKVSGAAQRRAACWDSIDPSDVLASDID